MTAVTVELLRAVAYDRAEHTHIKPLPGDVNLDRMTIVRADEVRAGDTVVGSVDQPLKRDSALRWATYLDAPFTAQPGPYEADCPNCRAWVPGAEGPWVTVFPHCPERPDELIAVVPADGPADPAPAPCVHTCTCESGFLPSTARFSPPAVCPGCHRRPCADCSEAGTSTH